ncbi:MAG: PqqD family protein, partial [Gemmatimonadaceae bacterium]
MDSRRFRINAPAAVSEEIDGEAVIMNLESGHYFSARGLSGILWQATIAGVSADELVNAVSAAWPDATTDADVCALLEHMLEHKLVVPAEAAP